MLETPQQLATRYGKLADNLIKSPQPVTGKRMVNAFTFPQYPIITLSPEIEIFNWGLIPSWVKSEADASALRKFTLNARADTIFQKPSFRESIMKRRCIVPSTGYYEWHHENGTKTPYYIYLRNEPIFSMGGIYDTWCDTTTGEIRTTFSIITTDANPLTAEIHNTKKRMPLIFSREQELQWLDTSLSAHDVETMLRTFPETNMHAQPADLHSAQP